MRVNVLVEERWKDQGRGGWIVCVSDWMKEKDLIERQED